MPTENISQYLKTHSTATVLILGYGKEGQSTHRYLHDNFPELQISIADQNKEITPLLPAKQLLLGETYLDQISNFDIIFRTPSISINNEHLQQALQFGKVVSSEMNLFFSTVQSVTIGVTGTKGKSTTSSLIAHFLSSKFPDVRLVGNIGTPALDQLQNAKPETIFVIELSSYQLEDLNFSPHVAVLLGINQEHLDHHGSYEKYTEAKKHIFQFQSAKDILIYDESNEVTKQLVQTAVAEKISFSETTSIDFSELNPKLIGKGYGINITAASTAAKQFGLTDEEIQAAIKTFQPLPHRLEYLGEKNGIKFYDDSISTIPEAAINAIEALPETETLIAGGFDRGIDYANFGQYLSRSKVKNLILFNPSGQKISDALEKNRESELPKVFFVESMQQAVELALQYTEVGKTCLLSPASASFGLFKDYIDRGNQYRSALGFAPSQIK